MKKTLFTLLSIILILLSLFLFLLFHNKGNELIRPYLNSYLSKTLPYEEIKKIEIEKLEIDMTNLKCTAMINGLTKLKLQGELSPFEKEKRVLHHIQIDIDQGRVEELLKIAKEKPYAKGEVDLEIKVPSLEGNLSNTTIKTTLHQVLLNEEIIKKELKVKIPPKTRLDGVVNSNLNQNIIISKGYLQTNFANIDFKEAKYYINTKNIESDYHIDIVNLENLQYFTHKKLQGSMEIIGTLSKIDKKLLIEGITNDLEGKIEFQVVDREINATLTDVSIQEVMKMLDSPQIFKAKIVGKLNYNLGKKEGIFNANFNQAHLLPNQFTNLIKELQGADLTEEIYSKTTFNAKFNQDIMKFDFYARSATTEIKLYPAMINGENSSIDANYNIQIDDKDIGGEIKGKIDDPKITIDSSKFLQKEITKKVEEYMDMEFNEDTLKKIGIGEKEKEVVKELFKGFLSNF